MKNNVNVLGTEYRIEYHDYGEEFSDGLDGYCSTVDLVIVIGNLETFPYFDGVDADKILVLEKRLLRHEIVHAFLFESGLDENAISHCESWATNEEMVDWIALQGVKIYEAWKEAEAL